MTDWCAIDGCKQTVCGANQRLQVFPNKFWRVQPIAGCVKIYEVEQREEQEPSFRHDAQVARDGTWTRSSNQEEHRAWWLIVGAALSSQVEQRVRRLWRGQ